MNKINILGSVVFFMASSLLYQNCAPSHSNFQTLSSNAPLQTGPVSFSSVEALFSAKCLACHTGASPANNNVDLSDYDKILASGIVVPSSSATSFLYQTIASGRMPPRDPLQTNDIALIRSWIDQGALGPVVPVNIPPTVSAGGDLVVTASAVSASYRGTASDTDGTISSVQWRQVSGPSAATLTGTDASLLQVANFVQGNYIFEFMATDNRGDTSSDQVQLTVQAVSTVNLPPLANAGADVTVTVGDSNVGLTATANDPDGSIQSMLWTQVSGPNTATLVGVTTLQIAVTNLVVGTYVFEFGVRDNQNAMATDRVSLVVSSNAPVTFTQVNSTILSPRCLNCHGGSRISGGFSVLTYATTMQRVQAGNAALSMMYSQVATENMPKSGAPLTAAQKMLIQTWINQGALNN